MGDSGDEGTSINTSNGQAPEDSFQMPRDNMRGWHLKKGGKGEKTLKYLLLPAVLRFKGHGYDWEEEREHDHWWERLETTGERKKFQEK